MNARWFLPAVAMLAGACAVQPPRSEMAASPFRDPAMTVEAAGRAMAPGLTKQEVEALLGPATAVRLDSGHEVWVYRAAPPNGKPREDPPELVVLFSPAGAVTKARVRPVYATPAAS